MNIILFQKKLSPEKLDALREEFHQYSFLSFSEGTYKNLNQDNWKKVEIIYGSRLSSEELQLARKLKWIHSPHPILSQLCLADLREKGDIILTMTQEENLSQIGEFFLGALLFFAKHFRHWIEADHYPPLLWDSKWRDHIWTLKDKTLVQIGLGRIGTELTKRARYLEMKVLGVQETPSFHPHCHEVVGFKHLKDVLERADVVSVALPPLKIYDQLLTQKEFALLKDDVVLTILGTHRVVNESDLEKCALDGKFRGILLDAFFQAPLSQTSRLWTLPNILITPEIASRPKASENQSLRNFKYNLRQYLHGNFRDMRKIVD